MAFNIEEFKAESLTFGGARPSKFEVVLTDWPGSTPEARSDFRFHCKASQIPPSIIGQIEVPYFGRTIKVEGDRTYGNWNTTILHDEDYNLRVAIEQWHQDMNRHIDNAMGGSVTPEPTSYKRNGFIRHYSRDGVTLLKTYTIIGLFPLVVEQMMVDWEARDQIMTFDVEWSIDYFLPYEASGLSENSFVSDIARNFNIHN